MVTARDRYESVLRSILAEGAGDGSFRSDVDKIDAIFILSILNAVERWYDPDGPLPPEALVRRILTLVGSGLSDAIA